MLGTRLTLPKVILILCGLFLVYPISILLKYARQDEDIANGLLAFSSFLVFMIGMVCFIIIASNSNKSAASTISAVRVNSAGISVLPIPSALAPYLGVHRELVDTQARAGGIPIPIAPVHLQTILALNSEFMKGAKTTEQESSVAEFMAAAFSSTTAQPYGDAADAANKC